MEPNATPMGRVYLGVTRRPDLGLCFSRMEDVFANSEAAMCEGRVPEPSALAPIMGASKWHRDPHHG